MREEEIAIAWRALSARLMATLCVQAELMRHLRAKGLLTHAEAKSMLFAAMEMMPPDLLADAQDAIEGLAARFER